MLPPAFGEAFPPSKGDALIAALRSAETPKARAKARYRASGSLIAHPDERVRLALAEHYRAHGTPNQAARWGITTSGWATPAEVRELRHWLLGRVDEGDYVRELLKLGYDKPLPDEVADLVDPAFRVPRPTLVRGSQGPGCALVVTIVIAVLVAIGSVGSAFVQTVFGGENLAHVTRIALIVAGVAVLVAAVAGGLQWLLDRRHRTARAAAYGRGFSAEAPFEPPSADPLFVTTLAWQLADGGDVTGARVVLRAALTRSLSDQSGARAALLALSRTFGDPAEAGRWGVGILGATTAVERDAYARSLAHAEDPLETTLRVRSVILAGDRLTADAHDVLRRVHRIRERRLASDLSSKITRSPSSRRTKPPERSTEHLIGHDGVSSTWWIVPVGILAVGAVVSATLAAIGSPAATPLARWCTVCVAASAGVALIREAIAYARSYAPRNAAITYVGVGATAIVGAVVFGVLLATGNA